eukprot:g4286.t1
MLHADDAVVVSQSADGVARVMTMVVEVFRESGLTMSARKTETLVIRVKERQPPPMVIEAAGQRYAKAAAFWYQGGLVNEQGDFTSRDQIQEQSSMGVLPEVCRGALRLIGAPFRFKARLLQAEAVEILLSRGPKSEEMNDDTAAAADDDSVDRRVDQLTTSLDFAWLFVCFVLVVLMQAGFAAYEVGTIRTTTSSSILKKNLGDASVSLCAWVLCGYGFASGEDWGRTAGISYFLLWRPGKPFEATEEDTGFLFMEFVFQWSFAATCTTIVSGAVADRIYMKAYFVYAFFTAALFYPLLAHAVWADEGWASPFNTDDTFIDCGVVDFAGSGNVHMLGGGISLVMAIMVKNRPDRFIDADEGVARSSAVFAFFERFRRFQKRPGEPSKFVNLTGFPQLNESGFRPNDPSWMTLGCFLLWVGWYGFNCGSTLQISTKEARSTAGRAAMNTTIGAAVGCMSSMIMEAIYHRCSPKYRRGKRIKDPLKPECLKNTDTKLEDEEDPDKKLEDDEDSDTQLEAEGDYDFQGDHTSGFTWNLSTHKDIHVAACNGVLAGLVGITAGCATMDPWPAILVSSASGFFYHIWYRVVLRCRIDDAVNAAAVHLFGGLWGLVAAGFTVVDSAREDLGYPDEEAGCTRQKQFLANFAMACIIFVYSLSCGLILWALFFFFKISDKTKDEKHKNFLDKEMDPELEKVDNMVIRHMRETDKEFKKLEKKLGGFRRDVHRQLSSLRQRRFDGPGVEDATQEAAN